MLAQLSVPDLPIVAEVEEPGPGEDGGPVVRVYVGAALVLVLPYPAADRLADALVDALGALRRTVPGDDRTDLAGRRGRVGRVSRVPGVRRRRRRGR